MIKNITDENNLFVMLAAHFLFTFIIYLACWLIAIIYNSIFTPLYMKIMKKLKVPEVWRSSRKRLL